MALILKDRVKQTASAPGTGTITLSGSVTGFQSFSSVGNGNTTYFAIVDPVSGAWEVNYGVYTSSGTTLTRNATPLSSSTGTLVNFTGAVDVFVTYPSENAVWRDTNGVVVQQSFGDITATSAALTSGTITGAPVNATDIVNKEYADSIASGLNYHQPVNYASTAALATYTYNNGASGVGATITAVANGALSLGGGSPTATQRVLVKDEIGGNAPYNGIYVVTQAGTTLLPFILTRATDYDTSGTGTNEIDAGDYVLVISGTLASTAWVQQTPLPVVVGTTAITFLQFNAPITYTAGTGLNLSPATTFNISNTGVTATTYGSASAVPVFAVNAQGQLTSVTNTNIAIAGSAVSGNISGSAGSVANALTAGSYLTSAGTYNGSAARTFAVDATETNTASKVVARDASGNFSAGTITAALSGNASTATAATNVSGGAANQIPYQTGAATTSFIAAPTTGGTYLGWNGSAFTYSAISTPSSVTFNNGGAGDASGTTFNGSVARTISYNTVGAPSTGGTGATGTWGISISGNAATATSATSASSATFATTAGSVTGQANSATITAATANTASTIVLRDASGNFSAGTITAALNGNASTATTAANVNDGTLTMNVAGTGLSGSQTFTANQSSAATFTVTSNATNANTGSTIVARDASGNFSAGTITAALSGNASTATSATSATTAGSITGQANSATITAASTNTASTIVLRDGSGNFSAGTITATLSGNASTATTASNANTVGGFTPSQTSGVANRVVVANGSGYIDNSYFYTSGGGSERNTSGMGYFAGFNTGDYYIRSYTAAAVASLLSGQTMNINGSSTSCTGNAATASSAVNLTGVQCDLGYSISGQNIDYSGQGGPQVRSQGGGAAMMSFHRPGDYAINFGLNTSNQLSTGGWSRGGNYVILDAGNYTSYAPSLTGSGASGTWGINITGSAGSAGSVDYANLTNKTGGTGTYTTSGDYRAPIFYDSNNTGYYLDPASSSQLATVYMDGWLYKQGTAGIYFTTYSYGIQAAGVTGTYGNITTYGTGQNGWNGYNLSGQWTLMNSGNGDNIGIHSNSTSWLWYWDGGVTNFYRGYTQFANSARAPIFYDSDNTGYYVDPAGASNMGSLTLSGAAYFRPNTWIQLDGSYGLYWPSNYGAHLHANDLSTYTQFAIRGSKNSYGGIYDYYSGVNLAMYDSAGNGGLYREANGRWYQYYNLSNDCTGFGTSSTSSAFNIYCPKGIYSGGRVDGTIFYDTNNTGYYLDPASTSNLNNVQIVTLGVGTGGSGTTGEIRATANVTAYYSSDIKFKTNVRDIPNALETVESIGGKLFDWTNEYIEEHGGEDGYFIQKEDFGVIAQDVLKVFPVAVRTRPDGSLAVDYEKLSALAFAAVASLSTRVKSLEARI